MRAAAALLALTAVTAAPALARADGYYFTEQLGVADVDDELAAFVEPGGHFAVRVAFGKRVGPWAFEGFLKVMDLEGRDGTVGDANALSFGGDFRYIKRLGPNTDGYLRGGLSKMRLHDGGGFQEPGVLDDYRGRAFEYGAGVQLHGRVRALGFLYPAFFFLNLGPKVKAALTIDWTRQFARLNKAGLPSIDAGINTLMFGFMVGGDF